MPIGAAADAATNLRAAGLTVLAVSMFALSDAVIKLLTAAYPPGQILFGRGVLACLFLVAWVRLRHAGPVRLPLRDPVCWLRSVLEFAASWCYFHALQQLPLAEATAVLFVFPLLLTTLAALVLREAVGPLRWSAVAAGLAGVLVMVRPGTAAFDPGALWALGAAAAIALRDLTTRWVRPAIGTASVALMTTGFSTLLALTSAPFGWVPLDGAGLLGLATTAALVSVAFVTIVAGTRIGDISFTAPFRYASVPLSFFLGFAIWGQVPDAFVLAGAAIVVLAGLVVLHLGRRR